MKTMDQIFLKSSEEETKNGNEQTYTPEFQEAEKVAREKLELLTTPGFKDFAIRFETFEEYKNILLYQGADIGKEIFVPSYSSNLKDVDFNDYLKNEGVGNWVSSINFQTDMIAGASSLEAEKYIMLMLNKIRSEVSKEKSSENNKEIKRETLRRFRDEILTIKKNMSLDEKVSKADRTHPLAWVGILDVVEEISQIMDELNEDKCPKEIRDLASSIIEKFRSGDILPYEDFDKLGQYETCENKRIAYIVKRLGTLLEKNFNLLFDFFVEDELLLGHDISEIKNYELYKNIDTLFYFIEDPDYIQKEGALRKVVQALVNNAMPGIEKMKMTQYNVAMIYHNDAIGRDKAHFPDWGKLDVDVQGKYPKEHLLGVIILLSDRQKVNKAVELSRLSGEFSHPIIDKQKIIRWPK